MFDLKSTAIVGAGIALWNQIKQVIMSIWSIFFYTIILNDVDMVRFFYRFITESYGYRVVNVGARRYIATPLLIVPEQRRGDVASEALPDVAIFFKSWKEIMFTGVNTGNGKNGGGNSSESAMTLTFLKRTIDPDKLVIDLVDFYNNQKHQRRYTVRRMVGFSRFGSKDSEKKGDAPNGSVQAADDSGREQQQLPNSRILKYKREELMEKSFEYFKYYAFPSVIKDLITHIERWKKSEKWYKEKQIPWRTGCLLYGRPGTGKYTLVRSVARHLDIPIFQFDLASMNNMELIKSWEEAQSFAPCICLFEDFDTIFNGRKNLIAGKNLLGAVTFDCFLNLIKPFIVEPHQSLRILIYHLHVITHSFGVCFYDTA